MEVTMPHTFSIRVTIEDLEQLLRSGSIDHNGATLRMADGSYRILPNLRDRIEKIIKDVEEFSSTPVDKWAEVNPDVKLPPTTFDNIDLLRRDEGDSLHILCDNPEAETNDRLTAVEVTGDWTRYTPLHFWANTWQEAVAAAANRRRASETKEPSQTKGQDGK